MSYERCLTVLRKRWKVCWFSRCSLRLGIEWNRFLIDLRQNERKHGQLLWTKFLRAFSLINRFIFKTAMTIIQV